MNEQNNAATVTTECAQNIELLRSLAQAASDMTLPQLTDGRWAQTIAEVLTSASGQPMGRSFEELFPLEDVSAWRDVNKQPLPALIQIPCGIHTSTLEVQPDDPQHTPQGQQYYLQRNVLPKAIARAFKTLRHVPADALQKMSDKDVRCLQQLQQILTGELPTWQQEAEAMNVPAPGIQGYQEHSAQVTPMIPRPYAVTV